MPRSISRPWRTLRTGFCNEWLAVLQLNASMPSPARWALSGIGMGCGTRQGNGSHASVQMTWDRRRSALRFPEGHAVQQPSPVALASDVVLHVGIANLPGGPTVHTTLLPRLAVPESGSPGVGQEVLGSHVCRGAAAACLGACFRPNQPWLCSLGFCSSRLPGRCTVCFGASPSGSGGVGRFEAKVCMAHSHCSADAQLPGPCARATQRES